VEFELGPQKVSADDFRQMYLERFAKAVAN
jgi:hypothetical protein